MVTRTLEEYLITIVRLSVDYNYNERDIYDNVDYFKQCYEKELSAYKAMEFLSFQIEHEEYKQRNKES